MANKQRNRVSRLACVVLLLVASSAIAGGAQKGMNSGFGPEAKSLQLSVEADESGAVIGFHLRNTGARSVTLIKEYSCSGSSHFWLEGGTDPAKLTSTYAYEPSRNGLTGKPVTTVCTRNVPVAFVRIRPGKSARISIAFAEDESLRATGQRFFRARAQLWEKFGNRQIQLQSPVAEFR